jgi:proline dehydrogenase
MNIISHQRGQKINALHRIARMLSGKSNIDFSDTKISFGGKSTWELTRAFFVFQSCRFPSIVSRSESLIKLSYKILGDSISDYALKKTFYGHFCAGENTEEIRPVVSQLDKNGIGSILDYAAEADISEDPLEIVEKLSEEERDIKVRTYDYKNEELCDARMNIFADCLRSANAVKGSKTNGFVAIKVTALTDPALLEKMSDTVVELRNLFLKFDENKSGFINADEFKRQYEKTFTGAGVDEAFASLDFDKDGKVDYVAWSNIITIEDLSKLTSQCRVQGPLFNATFTEEEKGLLKRMRSRLDKLAKLASEMDVHMMIDAEHTYFQPAIDNIAYTLMNKHNKDKAVIFSTYQMYLNDSMQRLETDLHRAEVGDYYFAAKLVRGAYMELERKRAKDMGYPDPIQPNKAATDSNYNAGVSLVMNLMGQKRKVELMIASHNQKSVELTIDLMEKYGLGAGDSVHFAQLMGMADHLTYGLGNRGFKAYKYVPYGQVKEVMPYLTRRAQENSGMLGGAINELAMLKREIKRRIFG